MSDTHLTDRRVHSVSCAIITVSDSRTSENDASGGLIRKLLEQDGHQVRSYEILPDEPRRVRERVVDLCGDSECQAVLLTGGTGVAARDTTYEAIAALLEKRLEGFGELFRMLSFDQIGAAAMLSRAAAGVHDRTVIFSMPGSTKAVQLAMEKLILPQLGHVVSLIND